MSKALIKPTAENLCTFGAEPLARWLVEAAIERTTITYGEAKLRLEREHGFSTIFPIMMGYPAGHVMSTFHKVAPKAPLLNTLLVQQIDRMPGNGAGPFMADYLNKKTLGEKNARRGYPKLWRRSFEKAASDVYEYTDWEALYKKAYKKTFARDESALAPNVPGNGTEKDGNPRGRGGEGPNHKALRLWVHANPHRLFGELQVLKSDTEVELFSGDRIDNVYYAAGCTVALEAKSRDSNEADLHRGIYQCVKYRAVLQAMDPREDARIDAVLVTEEPLPGFLKELAKRLDITHKQVSPDMRT